MGRDLYQTMLKQTERDAGTSGTESEQLQETSHATLPCGHARQACNPRSWRRLRRGALLWRWCCSGSRRCEGSRRRCLALNAGAGAAGLGEADGAGGGRSTRRGGNRRRTSGGACGCRGGQREQLRRCRHRPIVMVVCILVKPTIQQAQGHPLGRNTLAERNVEVKTMCSYCRKGDHRCFS